MPQAQPTIEQIAEKHWRTYLPGRYEAMTPAERTEFFRNLAEQVREQTAALAREYETNPNVTGTDFAQRVGLIAQARQQAYEQAMRELVFLEPEQVARNREL